MAAAPVQYQMLRDVQRTHAYTALNEVQKAVVHLLFIFYEKSHYFTGYEDATDISTALDTLYYTGGVAPAAGNDFMATITTLIAFENDSFFKNSMSDQFYLIAMNAIRTLYNNQGRLPVHLPSAVVPSKGPNPWVAREGELVDSISQAAYDAANAVEAANRGDITLNERTLRRYIRIMEEELRKPVWGQLQAHAKGIPQSQAGYEDNRRSIEQGIADANVMLGLIPQERQATRSMRSRSRSKEHQAGGKQSRKRRTMRRQQYKRRRLRTLHHR